MNQIRKASFGIALILGLIFCLEQMAFSVLDDSKIFYAIVDLDNSTEHGEDKKEENQLKEYKIQEYNRVQIESHYLNNCSKYRQFRIKHSLEVFLDVVTPPPEV